MEKDINKIDELTTRRARLEDLRQAGIDPYPAISQRSHTLAELIAAANTLIEDKASAIIVGRIRSVREHGGSTFAHLEDGTGKFQIYLKQDAVGDQSYKMFGSTIDVGDFVQAQGTIFLTKRGEPTLLVDKWSILEKTLLPLPEKWHGLQDIELRFRKRYLDLLASDEVKKTFITRAAVVKTIRNFLDSRNFLEVDTPILQSIPGGANARPFITHHNALDMDLYLRIAPELYLKRLIVGGYERVYEIARCFRNEGIDWSHNPEFSQVEFYQAFADYNDLMDETEDLLIEIVKSVKNSTTITYQEQEINFSKPWPRLTFRQSLIDFAKIDIEDYLDQKSIYKKAKELGLKDVGPKDGRGKICDELYKEYVRKHLVQPTFIIDHPIELSPLAKQKPSDPRYVERFQLVLGQGIELCNAFSELNDPDEQRRRFMSQQELRESGDEEAQVLDEDFIEALSHGMPPTAGFGMGIDRLTSLLTDNRNIKEVILFPTLRSKLTPSS